MQPSERRSCFVCQSPAIISDDRGFHYVKDCGKCVRYRITEDPIKALGSASDDTRDLLSAAAKRIATATGELPPKLRDEYVKRIDDRWWLTIGSRQSVDKIADIERELQQQEESEARGVFQRYADELSKSSHFQQAQQQQLLSEHVSLVSQQLLRPREHRDLATLRQTIDFLLGFAETPELKNLCSQVQQRFKAIGLLS